MKKINKNIDIFLKSLIVLVFTVGIVGGVFYYVDSNAKAKINGFKSTISENEKKISELAKNLLKFENQKERKIVVYGDTRTGHDNHQKITDLIFAQKPDAIFHTGDLVDNGTIMAEWTTYNKISEKLRNNFAYYPSLGNHEKDSTNFYNNFELPNNEQWYSVNVNELHFIVLNSTKDISPSSAQYKWLMKDLANIGDEIKFTAAIFHHPIYNAGHHEEDEGEIGKHTLKKMKEAGLDIVFSGHDHAYERSYVDGIYHIVAGGGGAPLREKERSPNYLQKYSQEYHYCVIQIVDGNLEITTYNIEDKVIDEFKIEE